MPYPIQGPPVTQGVHCAIYRAAEGHPAAVEKAELSGKRDPPLRLLNPIL